MKNFMKRLWNIFIELLFFKEVTLIVIVVVILVFKRIEFNFDKWDAMTEEEKNKIVKEEGNKFILYRIFDKITFDI